jgi:glutamyl-tRNA reductase
MDAFYEGLRSISGVRESFALSTCNRLEIYARVDRVETRQEIAAFLCAFNGVPEEVFAPVRRDREGLDVTHHLFEVAAGVDSQIVGEAEILGQIKEAYTAATRKRATGPILNRLLQKSFQVAKWVRTHTAIGTGQINVATVAVDLALKIFGRLEQTRILVIGTGDIGEKTARALQSRGAGDLTVTSRRIENAETLAARVAGRAEPIDILSRGLAAFDIVISSTSSPVALLGRAQIEEAMDRRAHRPIFLIDLAVPRDIEAICGEIDNVYLYNIDDLGTIAEANIDQRKAEVERSRPLLAERAERAWRSIEFRLQVHPEKTGGVRPVTP